MSMFSRPTALRSVLAALAVVLVSAAVAYGVSLSRSVSHIAKTWSDYVSVTAETSDSLARLQISLGYGGLIHNFKNFLLRREPAYAAEAARNVEAARRELSTLDGLMATEEQRAAIAELRRMVDSYAVRLELARGRFADIPIEDLDDEVRLDDHPALQALSTLVTAANERGQVQRRTSEAALAWIEQLMGIGLVLATGVIAVVLLLFWFFRKLGNVNAALVRSAGQVDALIDNAPDGILCVADNGTIARVNRRAAEIFEYDETALAGMSIDALVPTASRQSHERHRKRYLGNPSNRTMGSGLELQGLTRTGRELPVEIALNHLSTEHGRLTIASVRDVSTHRALTRELRAARRKADEANELKSAFLANMSHEIRTPLTGLLGLADLLALSDLDIHQARLVDALKSSGRHLEAVLSDILDISKLTAGKLALRQEPFDFTSLAPPLASMFGTLAEAKGVELRVELHPPPEGMVVHADPVRFRQILFNLVGNAVKFTNSGRVTVDLSVGTPKAARSEDDTAWLILVVTDTGIGIADAHLKTIFDPFVQVEQGKTRSVGGTGLGLAISRRLVEAMGGSIAVESQVGVGTTFRVEAPVTLVRAAEAGQASGVRAARDTPEPRIKSRRILVADDNHINRKLVQDMLAIDGHRVEAATHGTEALEMIVRGSYDVVLLDVHMPNLSGTEILRRLQEDDLVGDTRIFAFTADVMAESVDDYVRQGFDGVVAKPIDWDALKKLLAADGPGPAGEADPQDSPALAATRKRCQ